MLGSDRIKRRRPVQAASESRIDPIIGVDQRYLTFRDWRKGQEGQREFFQLIASQSHGDAELISRLVDGNQRLYSLGECFRSTSLGQSHITVGNASSFCHF